jgi:hypothetical protein
MVQGDANASWRESGDHSLENTCIRRHPIRHEAYEEAYEETTCKDVWALGIVVQRLLVVKIDFKDNITDGRTLWGGP